MGISEVQSDGGFRTALADRCESLEAIIEEVVELPPVPPYEQDRPGERNPTPPNPDNKRVILDESMQYFYEIRGLVDQFADPSAEGAQDRIGNLDNLAVFHFDKGLAPNEDGAGGLYPLVTNQLTGWNGDARYQFDWRFYDLLIALACQKEAALALRAAMKLHWGLLCAARAKVLVLLDNTIRTLQVMNQEADNEIGTFLKDVWTAVKDYVSNLNVVDLVVEMMKETLSTKSIAGPAKVLAGELWNLSSSVLGVAVDALTEPDSDDPRPTLRSAIEKIRDIRKNTQADSEKIAKNIGRLTEFLVPGERMYVFTIHEAGPALPPPGA